MDFSRVSAAFVSREGCQPCHESTPHFSLGGWNRRAESVCIVSTAAEVTLSVSGQARDEVIDAQRQELQLQSSQLVQLQHQLASCLARPDTFLQTLGDGGTEAEAGAET